MKPNLSIALGAGLISAAAFAAATAGPAPLRLFLLALLAIPVSLAGFSYNARTALLAALIGTSVTALLFPAPAVLLYAMAVLPAAGLVYLALLKRETGDGGIEWYPVGRIVYAAALISASLVALSLLVFTGDMETFRAAVKQAIQETIRQGVIGLPNPTDITDEQVSQVAELMIVLMPAVGAAMVLFSLLGAVWLGARVALASGTLVRPWPDIAAFVLPTGAPILLVAAFLAAGMLDGKPRLVALAYAGTLYFSYVLLGLAIVHFVSRGAFWRGPALVLLYVLLIVANSGFSLLLAMVGLSDSLYPFRRHGDGSPPPGAEDRPGD